jgi:hypothetical protein
MRLSIALLIFLVLFNAWGGLLQAYDVDDQLGISAETGNAPALEDAQASAGEVTTGEPTGQTLLGYYNNLINTLQGVLLGLQPGVQLLVNVVPSRIAEDIIIWAFGALPFIIVVDVLYFARGGGI